MILHSLETIEPLPFIVQVVGTLQLLFIFYCSINCTLQLACFFKLFKCVYLHVLLLVMDVTSSLLFCMCCRCKIVKQEVLLRLLLLL